MAILILILFHYILDQKRSDVQMFDWEQDKNTYIYIYIDFKVSFSKITVMILTWGSFTPTHTVSHQLLKSVLSTADQ